jgi:hypothetical protein
MPLARDMLPMFESSIDRQKLLRAGTEASFAVYSTSIT